MPLCPTESSLEVTVVGGSGGNGTTRTLPYGTLAAHHLVARGHRRIGVVAMQLEISACNRRVEGLRQALREVDLTLPDDLLAAGNFSEQDGSPRRERCWLVSRGKTHGLPAACGDMGD